MTRAPSLIPALLRFPGSSARQDSWGRLLRITAGGAELSTPAVLSKGEIVQIVFELGGEKLMIPARVHHAGKDDDGQPLAELVWSDMVKRRRLARVLLEVLAKS